MKAIKISVNELIEFSARSGDLSAAAEGPTAWQGQQAHRHVQAQRDNSWHKEYSLSARFDIEGFEVELRGRADLIHCTNRLIVEEIKSSFLPLKQISEAQLQFYLSQARVYAALYLSQSDTNAELGLKPTELRLCVITLPHAALAQLSQHESKDEIFSTVRGYLQNYCRWLKRLHDHRRARSESIATLAYPFESFRKGQHDLAKYIYSSIKHCRPLLVEAPTGLGKTIAALFPALKSLVEQAERQVLYLSCKTAGQIQPKLTAHHLRSRGAKIKQLTLIAKEKLCLCTQQEHAAQSCPYKCNYYDKLPAARTEAFACDSLDAKTLTEIATKHTICPFSLSLEMTKWSDLIIADLNYYFDPLVKLSHFSDNNKHMVLLIDEIHNLNKRAQEMYSASLEFEDVQQLQRAVPTKTKLLTRSDWVRPDLVRPDLVRFGQVERQKLAEFVAHLESQLAAIFAAGHEPQSSLFDAQALPFELIKKAIRFIAIYHLMGDAHCLVQNQDELKIQCIAAQPYLQNITPEKARMVGFSGTLRPIDYYRQSLGWPETAAKLVLPSPFSEENLGVFVCQFIDTRLRKRLSQIGELCSLVSTMVTAKPGNYMVFFPSFAYLKMFAEHWLHHCTDEIRVLEQCQGSTFEQERRFLEGFEDTQIPKLGLAVLGGAFAEGIDLKGNQLIGCLVVGLGIAPPSFEQQKLMLWLENNGLDPYLFGQLYPSYCKVLQAAGRVIRSEDDQGLVILADYRYTQAPYPTLFPEHWQIQHCHSQVALKAKLKEFWADRAPKNITI